MKLSLRNRIILLALVAALIPAITFSVFYFIEKEHISQRLNAAINEQTENYFTTVVRDIHAICESNNILLLGQMDIGIKVARKILHDAGNIETDAADTTTWQATNQFTQQTQELQLPRWKTNGQWLGQNADLTQHTPIVDDAFDLVGGTFTIFQRFNKAGDMLRIATNVQRLDGTRAIGTFIPVLNPNGQSNPVVTTVLQGGTYRGLAFVVNQWYLTIYEPIRDDSEEIIGMLYYGVPLQAIDSLRETIGRIQIGEQGGIWLTYGKDTARRGQLVLRTDEADTTQRLLPQNQQQLDKLITEAIEFTDNQTAIIEIPGESPQHDRILAYGYFAPWDWVIGLTAYKSDFAKPHLEVQDALTSLYRRSLIGGAIAVVVAILLAVGLGTSIARPIVRTAQVAGQVSEGDLRNTPELEALTSAQESSGEIQLLRDAISRMVQALRTLLGKVQKSSIQVISAATQIGAAVRGQEESIQNFGASTSEIAAAVRQINATSLELVKTMNTVQQAASETADRADRGNKRLLELDGIMSTLDSSSKNATARLAVIREKAQTIGAVVVTITKVADQTNLLSLNAAIEAEKAGEFGLGFSVVAREIRRLADQTAVATLDIEKMVHEMQSSVASGVMEMEKFSQQVRTGVEHTARISVQFGEIIAKVQHLLPQFDSVLEGMQAQNQGGNQINDAMMQLNQTAKETSASLREFSSAARLLHQAVDDLKEEVHRFKVD